MTERLRLPNRRASVGSNFEVGGLGYTCTFSKFADGRVGALFVSNHKRNSSAYVNARDAATAASLVLQFGCPLEIIRDAVLRDSQGYASSPLGAALDPIAEGREP